MSEEGRPSSHRRDDDGNDDEGWGSGTRDNGESGENLDGQEVANEKAETLRTLRTTNPRHLHFFKTKSNDLDRIDEVEDDEPEISATLAALAPIEDNNDSMNLSISLHDV
ncbi:expressed unknown protein [Seminavis robusta]|uniref:Uncharacterized protein n=1 Tax=Seminavis robusta TaxID=568900 RepID=A0A9N8DVT1_9STRA|nr:expressed unknown protein [Seminavis robusta]|eukprot:Sro409_g137250.1 n/a (110) ;mRNA; f:57474-57803